MNMNWRMLDPRIATDKELEVALGECASEANECCQNMNQDLIRLADEYQTYMLSIDTSWDLQRQSEYYQAALNVLNCIAQNGLINTMAVPSMVLRKLGFRYDSTMKAYRIPTKLICLVPQGSVVFDQNFNAYNYDQSAACTPELVTAYYVMDPVGWVENAAKISCQNDYITEYVNYGRSISKILSYSQQT